MKKESDEDRISRETGEVIEIMKQDFPLMSDYNVVGGGIEDDVVEILDKDDKVIATISSDRLTNYWNRMEGW